MARDTYTRLLSLFHSGKELSYDQARDQLNLTSIRQVQRLIALMKKNGVPIQERKNGHRLFFYISEDDRENGLRVVLAEEQLFALAVAAEAAKSILTSTPLAVALQKALKQLLHHFPIEVVPLESDDLQSQRGFRTNPITGLSPAVFVNIAQAVSEHKRVYIDYYAESQGRQWAYRHLIDPYGLAVRNANWLLVAYCHEKRYIREFIMANIMSLEPTEELFVRPESFDLKSYFGNKLYPVGPRSGYRIRLLVESRSVVFFYRKTYHPSQYIEEQKEDGRIVVAYTVDDLREISAFVQSWGTDITVLGPEELRTLILQELSESLIRYGILRRNN